MGSSVPQRTGLSGDGTEEGVAVQEMHWLVSSDTHFKPI